MAWWQHLLALWFLGTVGVIALAVHHTAKNVEKEQA
jgi:hypothetical protein